MTDIKFEDALARLEQIVDTLEAGVGAELDRLHKSIESAQQALIDADVAAAGPGSNLLLAGVGYGLATVFRTLTDWQQPEPEDRPFPGLRLRARKV